MVGVSSLECTRLIRLDIELRDAVIEVSVGRDRGFKAIDQSVPQHSIVCLPPGTRSSAAGLARRFGPTCHTAVGTSCTTTAMTRRSTTWTTTVNTQTLSTCQTTRQFDTNSTLFCARSLHSKLAMAPSRRWHAYQGIAQSVFCVLVVSRAQQFIVEVRATLPLLE